MKHLPSKEQRSLLGKPELYEDTISEKTQVDPSYLKQIHHILGDITEGLDNAIEDLETAFWLIDKIDDREVTSALLPKLKKIQHEVKIFSDIKELIEDLQEDVSSLLGE